MSNAHYPPLSKPPLKEAIIDIQLRMSDDQFKVQALAAIKEQFQDSFKDVEEIKPKEIGIQFQRDQTNITNRESLIGYKLVSADELNVLQIRENGFTYSRLEPYNDWTSFSQEAQKYWRAYREAIGQFTLARVAVRYINVLPVPLSDPLVLDRFLANVPKVPPELGDKMKTFFTRVVLPVPDLDSEVIITHSLEQPSSDEERLPVILDIDVYRTSVSQFTESEIWNFLDKLRHYKNTVFRSFITEKMFEILK